MEKGKGIKANPAAPTFKKEKLLTFQRFANRVDLLKALLTDGSEYTIEQAEAAIDGFMKGKVK